MYLLCEALLGLRIGRADLWPYVEAVGGGWPYGEVVGGGAPFLEVRL